MKHAAPRLAPREPTRASRRQVLSAGMAGALALVTAPARAAADNPENERWRALRESLFGPRPIAHDPGDVLELDTPVRAADAAVVPIAIRARQPQTPERYIRKIWLVVDHNPSPVGAVFTLTPLSGRADLETRIRLEEYTHVRAIAEMNDGTLSMRTRYVKASGGCSAPAGKDLQAALAGLGRLRLRVDESAPAGQPRTAQLMVSHPNVSGLAIDQVSRLAPTPQFVRQIDITYDGQPVLSAEVDFTLSENPALRFQFLPKADGQSHDLRAVVQDTNDRRFETTVAVAPDAPG